MSITVSRFFMMVILSAILFGCKSEKKQAEVNISTVDIAQFWEAYDLVVSTEDSTNQAEFLQNEFFDKASEGQQQMFRARNYSVAEYQHSINSYPKFWKSIRGNMPLVEEVSQQFSDGITKLKKVYSNLKPAKIYFTIGALRSNGTTMDSLVLIGAELALANEHTVTDEFPDNLSHLKSYFESKPSENIVFLNIHEYVHTQQNTTIGENLLAQTVIEGVAEFVAEKALEISSPNPQISYGQANDAEIKAAYEKEMFSPYVYNWIWNNSDNDFEMRDLAYYVGYRISEEYYNASPNKEMAITEMIELDYNNEEALVAFVEKSAYFEEPLSIYKERFEESRPSVTKIDGLKNNSTQVPLETEKISVTFSEKMDVRYRNFEYGPLGENAVMRFNEFLGFSEDQKTISFSIQQLAANKHYQITIGPGFRNIEGIPLKPYLIDFTTSDN